MTRDNDRLDAAVRAYRARLGDHGHHVTLAERDAMRHALASWRDSDPTNDILAARIDRVVTAVLIEANRAVPGGEITIERLRNCRRSWVVEWADLLCERLAREGVTIREIGAFMKLPMGTVRDALRRARGRVAAGESATKEIRHHGA